MSLFKKLLQESDYSTYSRLTEAYDFQPASVEEIEKSNYKHKQEAIKVFEYLKAIMPDVDDPIAIDLKQKKIKVKRIFAGSVDLQDLQNKTGASLAFGNGSGVSAAKVSFAGGRNTLIGESIQTCGFFLKK